MKKQVSGETKHSDIHGIRKADIVLIVVCLLTSALLAIFFIVHRESGREARILYDGIELLKLDLYSVQTDSEAEENSQYYLITYRDDVVGIETYESRPELPEGVSHISYNLISVTNGMVVVESADCKDQICVQHKPVSSKGESIICLPHKLVVEVVGDDMSGESLDGVVR